MGAGPVVLRNLADILELFEEDEGTVTISVVGEVGGLVARRMTKPAGRMGYQTRKEGGPGVTGSDGSG